MAHRRRPSAHARAQRNSTLKCMRRGANKGQGSDRAKAVAEAVAAQKPEFRW